MAILSSIADKAFQICVLKYLLYHIPSTPDPLPIAIGKSLASGDYYVHAVIITLCIKSVH